MKKYALNLKTLFVGILVAALFSIYIFNSPTNELTNAEIIENSSIKNSSSMYLNTNSLIAE